MPDATTMNEPVTTCDMEIRVRYAECDPMGLLHHSRYFEFFEMGRTELLRASGIQYRDIETAGYFYVVAKIECRFKAPAYYDDVIVLTTTIARQTRARIDHAYVIKRDGRILCEATSTLACVDRSGRPAPIPDEVLQNARKQPITPHTDRINP
jgi:acyl-CoA thioester hydrolase